MKTSTPVPVGPYNVSIQPGAGSRAAAVTIDGLTIVRGTSPRSIDNICSAKAFVYV